MSHEITADDAAGDAPDAASAPDQPSSDLLDPENHGDDSLHHGDARAIATTPTDDDSEGRFAAADDADRRTFADLDLQPEILQALDDMGYERPMPVQLAVYGPMSAGRDIMVQSRTGSGKTSAFGIPIAQRIDPDSLGAQALILAPTRELALQVSREIAQIAVHKALLVQPVYGGAPIKPQIDALSAGAQIIVGTPGRVLDHLRRGTFKPQNIGILVLDECDEMLSMGFQEEIEKIIEFLPAKTERQTVLFSATIPDEIQRIARRHMNDPEEISLSTGQVTVDEISHYYYVVSGVARTRELLKVLRAEAPESAIIFCNTREETNTVAKFLQRQGYDAEAISSDLTQRDRERVMKRMRDRNLQFLVATDVAARGIDISDLSHVINYTFPESPEVYVHRTGRTGRAGKSGVALSLVGPRELGSFYYLKLIYKIRPEERDLPSSEEMGVLQEGERYERVAALVREEPGAEQRALARRIWQSNQGERIVGALVQRLLSQHARETAAAESAAGIAPARVREPRSERSEEPREAREARDVRQGDRDERRRERWDEGRRDERPREDRDERRRERRDERPREDRDERRRERRDERARDERPRDERSRDERPREDRDERRRERRDERARDERPRDERPRDERPREDRDERRRERRDERARDERARDERPREERDERRREREERRESRPDALHDARPEAGRDARRDATPERAEERAEERRESHPEALLEGVRDATPERAEERAEERLDSRSEEPRERGEDRRDARREERRREKEARREEREARRKERQERRRRGSNDEREGAADERDERGTGMREHATEDVEREPARSDAARSARAGVTTTAPEPADAWSSDEGPDEELDDEAKEFWETWADEKAVRRQQARTDENQPRNGGRDQARARDAEPAAARKGRNGNPGSSSSSSRDREDAPARARDAAPSREREDAPARARDAAPSREREDTPPRVRDAAPARTRGAARDTARDIAPGRSEDDDDATESATGESARLYVNIGKREGLSASDVRQILGEGVSEDKAGRIGSVALRNTHCYVRVPEDIVDDVIAAAAGKTYEGREMVIERARR
jgi:ATP-dependent RNA helicase DeaD